jgi:hypothetical protein
VLQGARKAGFTWLFHHQAQARSLWITPRGEENSPRTAPMRLCERSFGRARAKLDLRRASG